MWYEWLTFVASWVSSLFQAAFAVIGLVVTVAIGVDALWRPDLQVTCDSLEIGRRTTAVGRGNILTMILNYRVHQGTRIFRYGRLVKEIHVTCGDCRERRERRAALPAPRRRSPRRSS